MLKIQIYCSKYVLVIFEGVPTLIIQYRKEVPLSQQSGEEFFGRLKWTFMVPYKSLGYTNLI